MLLSTGVLTALSGLSDRQFLAWGWRVPFLLSIVLLGVGLFVRSRVAESPAFEKAKASNTLARLPLIEVLRRNPANLVRACGVGFGAFVAQSLLTTFVIAYAVRIGYPRSEVLTGLTISSGLAIVGLPFFASLSDRFGRRPVVLGGALSMAVAAFPLFALINTGSPVLLTVALIIGQSILHPAMYGPMAALLTEMFGTNVRYTGASLGYQLAAVLGAGFAPLIAGSLLSAAGGSDSSLVSLYLVAGCAVTAVAIWFTRETSDRSAVASPTAAVPARA
jgi:MFS family permease